MTQKTASIIQQIAQRHGLTAMEVITESRPQSGFGLRSVLSGNHSFSGVSAVTLSLRCDLGVTPGWKSR